MWRSRNSVDGPYDDYDDENYEIQMEKGLGGMQRCGPSASLPFYLLPSLVLLLLDTVLFVLVWLRFTGAKQRALPPHLAFIRRESAVNFALMILFTVTWAYELLAVR